MSNNWDEFSNGFEELFNAPFGADESPAAPLEPDLTLEVGAYTMRFVILDNALDFPPNEQHIVKGAITLGALDIIPNEQGFYNTLRDSFQSFMNRAGMGGLLMVNDPAHVRFAGIQITPLAVQPRQKQEHYIKAVKAVIQIQYLATRPRSAKRFYQTAAGIWQEGESDER